MASFLALEKDVKLVWNNIDEQEYISCRPKVWLLTCKTFHNPGTQERSNNFWDLWGSVEGSLRGSLQKWFHLWPFSRRMQNWYSMTSMNRNFSQAFTATPVFGYPALNKPFILTTDASTSGLGYILFQLDSAKMEAVIAYGGRGLQKSEVNWGNL
jgi:hypothetical protein